MGVTERLGKQLKHVLVIRNDKIGDFMLAWPALALLKQAGCKVAVLVPNYTADLAHACPYVDNVILDPGKDAPFEQQKQLLAQIVESGFDAALTLYSTWRTGVLLRQAGIAYRLAPATKFAQILHTHRLAQRRSRSDKPEWEYNLDLAATLLKDQKLPIGYVGAPYWTFDNQLIEERRKQLAESLSLPVSARWLMVHVGSGGSANNLSLAQYEALIASLTACMPDAVFVLTAGPSEQSAVGHALANLINRRVPVAMVSPDKLVDFGLTIATADVFLAGSTGPLHMAGALDVPTVGFYTQRRSATSLRWQTLNSPGRRLALSPTPDMPDPEKFDGLDVEAVARQVSDWLRGLRLKA